MKNKNRKRNSIFKRFNNHNNDDTTKGMLVEEENNDSMRKYDDTTTTTRTTATNSTTASSSSRGIRMNANDSMQTAVPVAIATNNNNYNNSGRSLRSLDCNNSGRSMDRNKSVRSMDMNNSGGSFGVPDDNINNNNSPNPLANKFRFPRKKDKSPRRQRTPPRNQRSPLRTPKKFGFLQTKQNNNYSDEDNQQNSVRGRLCTDGGDSSLRPNTRRSRSPMPPPSSPMMPSPMPVREVRTTTKNTPHPVAVAEKNHPTVSSLPLSLQGLHPAVANPSRIPQPYPRRTSDGSSASASRHRRASNDSSKSNPKLREEELPVPPPPLAATQSLVRQTSLSQGLSVSKHYALSNQILMAFDKLYNQGEYRGAYAFGIRYVEVALIEIPKHGYFYSKRHKQERIQNSKNALRVTKQIQFILTVLDSKPPDGERELINRLYRLAEEQVATEEQDLYEKERLEVETELARQDSLCGDILDYVEMICPSIDPTRDNNHNPSSLNSLYSSPSDISYPNISPNNNARQDYSMPLSHTPQQTMMGRQTSQDSFRSINSDAETLHRALMLSGGVMQLNAASAERPMHPDRKRRSQSELSIQILRVCYHDDFEELRNQGRLRVSQANTHQGRNPGSTNGCSLIAPLLCYHHFHNDSWEKGDVDSGLTDGAIGEVIDTFTPSLLPEVRSNLGLYKDALIIPSDVHSFLIEKELLSSEQFVTVCGGDILNEKHLMAFTDELKSLNEGPNSQYHGRKIAATFFFHEHIISILKLRRSSDEYWYDVIDSLPKEKTLRRGPLLDYETEDPYFVPNTSRIRCMNNDALKATLKWYGCSRFTDENMAYVDMYDWDESYSDFDPRVFQAFIWAA